MEYITKLEKKVLGWLKDLPHLPLSAKKWLGINLWWIVLIVAVLSVIGFFASLNALFTTLTLLNSYLGAYFAVAVATPFTIVKIVIGLAFSAISIALLIAAIKPLKEKSKKGWVLLFVSLLVNAVSVVVLAVLTLNPFTFIMNVLFGAVVIGVGAYILAEVHGQFAHDVKVAKVTKVTKTTKTTKTPTEK